jgi:tRNA(Arg) A34 adenosine deaminase TadA
VNVSNLAQRAAHSQHPTSVCRHHDHHHHADTPSQGVQDHVELHQQLGKLPTGPKGEVAVSPGVMDLRNSGITVESAEKAAELATLAAEMAGQSGTFAVGGILLGPGNQLLAISMNQVLKDGKLLDPTAHGERQIVDWYFEKEHQGESFPKPEDMTIVSSLDPCVMCGNSIIESGMNVAIISKDVTAGLDFKGDGQFTSLPEELRDEAQDQFSYFGTDGGRAYQGSDRSPFTGARIPGEIEQRSLDAFLASLSQVKKTIGESGSVEPEELKDPALHATPEIKAALHKQDSGALSIKVDPKELGPELGARLTDIATRSQMNGNSFDAAALVDPFGNVLVTTGGQESHSPIRTPFMELTRKYAEARSEAGADGIHQLAHFKHCTVVTLYGPGDEATDIMELGAYGSSVEGPLPEGSSRHWQYIRPRQSEEELQQTVDRLPPLYSEIIKPDIKQVDNPEMLRQFGG